MTACRLAGAGLKRSRRKLLATTISELADIAAPANSGLR